MNTIIIFHSNELSQEKEESLITNISKLLLHLGSEPIQIHSLNKKETVKCLIHEVTKSAKQTIVDDILVKVDTWCKTLIKMTGIPSKTISKESYAALIARALTSNINLRNADVLVRLSQMTEGDTALINVLKTNKLDGFISAKKMAEILKSLRVLGYVEQ